MKTSCPSAENVNETPGQVCINKFYKIIELLHMFSLINRCVLMRVCNTVVMFKICGYLGELFYKSNRALFPLVGRIIKSYANP